VSANGNTPIIFLSDAAEPRCVRKKFSREDDTIHGAAAAASGSPLPARRAETTGVNPAFGTGQVADYGRLRWAVYSQ
jgi:hypothetical protein